MKLDLARRRSGSRGHRSGSDRDARSRCRRVDGRARPRPPSETTASTIPCSYSVARRRPTCAELGLEDRGGLPGRRDRGHRPARRAPFKGSPLSGTTPIQICGGQRASPAPGPSCRPSAPGPCGRQELLRHPPARRRPSRSSARRPPGLAEGQDQGQEGHRHGQASRARRTASPLRSRASRSSSRRRRASRGKTSQDRHHDESLASPRRRSRPRRRPRFGRPSPAPAQVPSVAPVRPSRPHVERGSRRLTITL